jgi:hypothetical protein
VRAFDVLLFRAVYPGDEIVTDIGRNGDVMSLRRRVGGRDATVLTAAS